MNLENINIEEYAKLRFIRSNHPKYHKYCDEWVKNMTENQKTYFNDEKNRKIYLKFDTF